MVRYVRTRSSVAGLFTRTRTVCSGRLDRLPVYAGLAESTNGLVLYIGLSSNRPESLACTARRPGAHWPSTARSRITRS